jgi:hypothetical protein
MFEDAGMRPLEARTIRVGDSRVITAAQRRPGLWRLPALPWLIEWEARRMRNVPLTSGRYTDVAFVAAKK